MYVRIGITTSYEEDEQRLNRAYVQAVERAGGLPVIIPLLGSDAAYAHLVRELDALVLTGGPAITEGLVGALPPDIAETNPLRVESDRRIMDLFLAARKPILGICHGMQLLNARQGGTIYADVQQQVEGILTHSNKRGGTEHQIYIEPGSHLYNVLHRETATVNTRHIQAIATLGNGFRVAATAPDGVVEAIENEDGSILGVQFHPERMEDMLPLFESLVTRMRETSPDRVVHV